MNGEESIKIKGVVVVHKNDFPAGNNHSELPGNEVSLKLVCTDSANASSELRESEAAYLQNWSTQLGGVAGNGMSTVHPVEFKWHSGMGIPAAFFINNSHGQDFFLKSLTLQLPGQAQESVHFVCNSWVYPASRYKTARVFFSNRTYLPCKTPPALLNLRNEELASLQGDGKEERQEWDRVYDYDLYNDLGNPDKDDEYRRQVLGGSKDFPYPRRGRTGRPPTKTDPESESRLSILSSLDIFVPRDERFGRLKLSDFLVNSIQSVGQFLVHELKAVFDSTPIEFDSFEDIMKLYSDGINLPGKPVLDGVRSLIPFELIKGFLTTAAQGRKLLEFPTPQVIARDALAWRKDEEFARQMLSGVNPVLIQRLQSFPPRSALDPEIYGPQMSSITVSDVEKSLDDLTVEQRNLLLSAPCVRPGDLPYLLSTVGLPHSFPVGKFENQMVERPFCWAGRRDKREGKCNEQGEWTDVLNLQQQKNENVLGENSRRRTAEKNVAAATVDSYGVPGSSGYTVCSSRDWGRV